MDLSRKWWPFCLGLFYWAVGHSWDWLWSWAVSPTAIGGDKTLPMVPHPSFLQLLSLCGDKALYSGPMGGTLGQLNIRAMEHLSNRWHKELLVCVILSSHQNSSAIWVVTVIRKSIEGGGRGLLNYWDSVYSISAAFWVRRQEQSQGPYCLGPYYLPST